MEAYMVISFMQTGQEKALMSYMQVAPEDLSEANDENVLDALAKEPLAFTRKKFIDVLFSQRKIDLMIRHLEVEKSKKVVDYVQSLLLDIITSSKKEAWTSNYQIFKRTKPDGSEETVPGVYITGENFRELTVVFSEDGSTERVPAAEEGLELVQTLHIMDVETAKGLLESDEWFKRFWGAMYLLRDAEIEKTEFDKALWDHLKTETTPAVTNLIQNKILSDVTKEAGAAMDIQKKIDELEAKEDKTEREDKMLERLKDAWLRVKMYDEVPKLFEKREKKGAFNLEKGWLGTLKAGTILYRCTDTEYEIGDRVTLNDQFFFIGRWGRCRVTAIKQNAYEFKLLHDINVIIYGGKNGWMATAQPPAETEGYDAVVGLYPGETANGDVRLLESVELEIVKEVDLSKKAEYSPSFFTQPPRGIGDNSDAYTAPLYNMYPETLHFPYLSKVKLNMDKDDLLDIVDERQLTKEEREWLKKYKKKKKKVKAELDMHEETLNEEEIAFFQEVANRLNTIMKTDLTAQDYYDWMWPGDGYDKFDNVVKDYLGEEAFNTYDYSARLDAKLMYELGLGEKSSGGVNLTKLPPPPRMSNEEILEQLKTETDKGKADFLQKLLLKNIEGSKKVDAKITESIFYEIEGIEEDGEKMTRLEDIRYYLEEDIKFSMGSVLIQKKEEQWSVPVIVFREEFIPSILKIEGGIYIYVKKGDIPELIKYSGNIAVLEALEAGNREPLMKELQKENDPEQATYLLEMLEKTIEGSRKVAEVEYAEHILERAKQLDNPAEEPGFSKALIHMIAQEEDVKWLEWALLCGKHNIGYFASDVCLGDRSSTEFLEELFYEGREVVRREALYNLAERDRKDIVMEALGDPSVYVVQTAIQFLGQWQDVDNLLEVLWKTDDQRIIDQIAYAFKEDIKNKTSYFINLLKTETDPVKVDKIESVVLRSLEGSKKTADFIDDEYDYLDEKQKNRLRELEEVSYKQGIKLTDIKKLYYQVSKGRYPEELINNIYYEVVAIVQNMEETDRLEWDPEVGKYDLDPYIAHFKKLTTKHLGGNPEQKMMVIDELVHAMHEDDPYVFKFLKGDAWDKFGYGSRGLVEFVDSLPGHTDNDLESSKTAQEEEDEYTDKEKEEMKKALNQLRLLLLKADEYVAKYFDESRS